MTEQPTVYLLKVVVFKGQKSWIAQCLDHDIAAQADSPEELPGRFGRALAAEFEFSQQQGVEPLSMLPPAPDRYWAMFYGSMPVRDRKPWLSLSESVRQLVASLSLETRVTPTPAV